LTHCALLRFIKSAKKTQILHDLLRERGRLKSSEFSSLESSASAASSITPYPPPPAPLSEDFWDFAGVPPPTRRLTNIALPPQPLRVASAAQVDSSEKNDDDQSAQLQQRHQGQQQRQPLSEAQEEKILTLIDEALLRALSKCDDDALRVSGAFTNYIALARLSFPCVSHQMSHAPI
jgi:hypothetical protein